MKVGSGLSGLLRHGDLVKNKWGVKTGVGIILGWETAADGVRSDARLLWTDSAGTREITMLRSHIERV